MALCHADFEAVRLDLHLHYLRFDSISFDSMQCIPILFPKIFGCSTFEMLLACVTNCVMLVLCRAARLIEEGILAVLVPLLKEMDTPALIMRHAIRCISCIGMACSSMFPNRDD